MASCQLMFLVSSSGEMMTSTLWTILSVFLPTARLHWYMPASCSVFSTQCRCLIPGTSSRQPKPLFRSLELVLYGLRELVEQYLDLDLTNQSQPSLWRTLFLVSDRSQAENTDAVWHTHARLPHELDVDVWSLRMRNFKLRLWQSWGGERTPTWAIRLFLRSNFRQVIFGRNSSSKY